MPTKEKKDGKLNIWLQAKVQAVKEWYNRDDNFLRVVRFPGTKLPLMDVLINFFKLFTKGRTVDRAAGVAFNFFLALFPLILFFFTLFFYKILIFQFFICLESCFFHFQIKTFKYK